MVLIRRLRSLIFRKFGVCISPKMENSLCCIRVLSSLSMLLINPATNFLATMMIEIEAENSGNRKKILVHTLRSKRSKR
ncbi:hypothetical protein T08_8483 [Trichinella sp. T8]|nr:hypothetical protein T08_8483 [Trichinella sp. T8]